MQVTWLGGTETGDICCWPNGHQEREREKEEGHKRDGLMKSSDMLVLTGQAMLKIKTTGRVCRKCTPEDGADRVVTYILAQAETP